MRLPNVEVTAQALIIDGFEVPWPIVQDGIRFETHDDINRLIVEFFVGETTFRDQWQINHDGEWEGLRRAIHIENRTQHRAIERIIKEFNV